MTRLWQAPIVRSARHLASPQLWYRQFTAASRPLPRFIIAGAQKAGTTSLFGYLADHPQCAASLTKEVHYFDEAFERGENWYRSNFPLGVGERHCFESSPYYMFDPRVPSRVKQTLPDVKLIFLLRNPASRAYSHYQHSRRRGREPLSFAEAIAAEPQRMAGLHEHLLANPTAHSAPHRHHSYVTRGHYAQQLETWVAQFAREQIMVVQAERLFKQPGEVFADVCRFLELDAWRPREFATHNSGRYHDPMPIEIRQQLTRHFEPANERLFDLLGVRYDWR
jgi:hypothetical protein